jgi:serine/threonine-protein kinase RsbT
MESLKSERLPIRTPQDLVIVRQAVRSRALELKFSLVDQTKLVTAASELARNTLDYGKGGVVDLDSVNDGLKTGLRLTFIDEGPGIPDIQQALKDGFTTGHGMGLGLGGAKRLAHDFRINSEVGKGTTVTLVRWRSP